MVPRLGFLGTLNLEWFQSVAMAKAPTSQHQIHQVVSTVPWQLGHLPNWKTHCAAAQASAPM